MAYTLQLIYDWSEMWAPLIPISVLLFRRNQPAFLRPVIFYIWVGFLLNLAIDIIADFKSYMPDWLQSNNPLYNLHSVIRFICFSYFFFLLDPYFRGGFNKIMNTLVLVLALLNFILVDDFFNTRHLSGNLLALEAFILLVFCLQYYLYLLKGEAGEFLKRKDFWVVTGLAIYVVINFFVFLFYVPLLTENPDLADRSWSIHNLAYITFCIFIAKAFYDPA